MRISSGVFRSIKLNTLDSNKTRPTLAKVKEAIFSMISKDVYDARCLDLFSGSGALGIEALSNHASFVLFNDVSFQANKVIKENLAKIKVDNYQVVKQDYQSLLNKLDDSFDIIFLDPPYHLNLITKTINLIITNNLLNDKGLIVCEVASHDEIIEFAELELIKNKKYGQSRVLIYRRLS